MATTPLNSDNHAQITPGKWAFACDSYGKVRHSKKACVYTTLKGEGGDSLVTVAARINNWADAKLIAAAPCMARVLSAVLHQMQHGEASDLLNKGVSDSYSDLRWCRDQIEAVLKSIEVK